MFVFFVGDFFPDHDANKNNFLKMVDMFALNTFLNEIFIILIIWSYFASFPQSPSLPGSLYLNSQSPWYFHLLTQLVPDYLIMTTYLNAGTVVGPIVYYGFILVPLLATEFKLGKASNKIVDNLLSQQERLITTHRSFQILQLQIVNPMVGKFLVPTQAISTLLFVFSSFILIKHGNSLETVSYILMICWMFFGLGFWSCCLIIGGYLHSNGVKTLNSWKYHQHRWNTQWERKFMKRFGKSCRPMMLCFGKTYTVRRTAVLGFLQGLSRGLVRALLTIETQ